MTAKDFLKQYEYANQRANRLRESYETELQRIDAIGSTLSGDGQPHGTGVSRKTEDKAIKLADAAKAWKEAELNALEEKQKVFNLIWDIPDVEGEVLYERYINLRKWEDVAETIHYSLQGVFSAHRRALRIVERRLADE